LRNEIPFPTLVAVKFTKSLQKARHIFPTELYSIG
jgi:hypothetical protein